MNDEMSMQVVSYGAVLGSWLWKVVVKEGLNDISRLTAQMEGGPDTLLDRLQCTHIGS